MGVGKFVCSQCGKQLVTKRYLVQHERTAHGTQEIHCQVGPGAFLVNQGYNLLKIIQGALFFFHPFSRPNPPQVNCFKMF